MRHRRLLAIREPHAISLHAYPRCLIVWRLRHMSSPITALQFCPAGHSSCSLPRHPQLVSLDLTLW
ncbi:hypothetical protein BDP81DRAFT_413913 [Colletotrichum phormii]|uniref:Uncharacterized protein n=1 Tax=Colletotrichum phormii TaxID=359342 RepID=A0AAJ0A3U5_9PEZI|nr:uncharacterized protein BDP81DRAFT_413913 [Colletotrichum phormii]KAK1655978.1 hypothetical protein BDP81DRAFT_413913 [Colletotrichum phormii]